MCEQVGGVRCFRGLWQSAHGEAESAHRELGAFTAAAGLALPRVRVAPTSRRVWHGEDSVGRNETGGRAVWVWVYAEGGGMGGWGCRTPAREKNPLPHFRPPWQSLLHIAVIKSCADVTRFLVRKCPELLTYRATGDFFMPGNQCYYGELPLSFAVCTNQGDLVRILLDADADPTLTDDLWGNNALHMAVLHEHQEMYDLLLAEWAARKDAHPEWADPGVCLSKRPNKAGQQCLALAAAESSAEMFDHVLVHSGQVGLPDRARG